MKQRATVDVGGGVHACVCVRECVCACADVRDCTLDTLTDEASKTKHTHSSLADVNRVTIVTASHKDSSTLQW